jgi:hypothetical protein
MAIGVEVEPILACNGQVMIKEGNKDATYMFHEQGKNTTV